ncbi:MAG: hypothetical protein OEV43_07905 [Coriobacteriia bacterium]|nr:hypothetical protein [Coriobacteriia bacterium]
MRDVLESAKMAGFALVIVGTLGLLLNEFVLDWGRPATLSFAAANAAGLLVLGLAYLRGGRERRA